MGNRSGNNIDKYNEEFKFNKNAFDDVIGDPFGHPEPVQGNYMRLQSRSSIMVAKNDFDSGHATRNAAQPSPTDFFCDVDRIVKLGLDDDKLVEKFYATYIYESEDGLFTARERSKMEQTLGKLFRKHKISPVTKYFQTIRQSLGEKRNDGKPRARYSL